MQIKDIIFTSYLRIWYVENTFKSCSTLNLDNALLDIFKRILDEIFNSFDSSHLTEISTEVMNLTNANKYGNGDGNEENDYHGIKDL